MDKLPAGVKDEGGFNSLPTPFRKMTVDEWIHRMHCYGLGERQEYRQWVKTGVPMTPVYICWYHDGAVAMCLPTDWTLRDGKISYKGRITYYWIGCEHDYDRATIGKCLHRESCKHCGHVQVVDSSD